MVNDKKHEILQAIKSLSAELGRAPSRDEFRERTGLEYYLKKHFRSYSVALHACGMTEASFLGGGSKAKKDFKYKKSHIQGHTVHDYELNVIFDRAGNPKSLKVLCIPDTHVPFHDVAAVKVLMQFIDFYKPDVIIILGDFMDMNGISHWPSSSFGPRRIVPEILEGRKLLAEIKATAKTTTSFFYLEGNHEDWLKQALAAKLPELADGLDQLGTDLTVQGFLQLAQLGIEFIPLNHILRFTKTLGYTHGLFTSDNHPKKHLDVLKCSLIYGHLHDVKSTNQTSVDGHMEAHSAGTLSRLDAPFLKGRPNNWVHNLTTVEYFPDGQFHTLQNKIFNGKMSFMGQVFDGNT